MNPSRLIAPLLPLTLFAALAAHADTKIYNVQGMHCGGCVKSVKAKICQLPGVESCQVEVNKVTLTGTLDDEAIKAAVASTGEYSVTDVITEPVKSEKPAAPVTPAATKPAKKTGS